MTSSNPIRVRSVWSYLMFLRSQLRIWLELKISRIWNEEFKYKFNRNFLKSKMFPGYFNILIFLLIHDLLFAFCLCFILEPNTTCVRSIHNIWIRIQEPKYCGFCGSGIMKLKHCDWAGGFIGSGSWSQNIAG